MASKKSSFKNSPDAFLRKLRLTPGLDKSTLKTDQKTSTIFSNISNEEVETKLNSTVPPITHAVIIDEIAPITIDQINLSPPCNPIPETVFLENQERTGNKLGKNWEQTGKEVGTNWERTGNNNLLDGQDITQEVGKNWEQTGKELGTKVGTKVGKKIQRLPDGSPIEFKSKIPLNLIKGKQLNILIFLHQMAIEKGGKDNRIALKITAYNLAHAAETTEDSAKKLTIQ